MSRPPAKSINLIGWAVLPRKLPRRQRGLILIEGKCMPSADDGTARSCTLVAGETEGLASPCERRSFQVS